MLVSSLKEIGGWTGHLAQQFEDIFYISSVRQEFSSPQEKTRFFEKWTSFYLESCTDEIFLALDDDHKTLLGYLTGCQSSLLASNFLEKVNPSYALFQDLFHDYEAHLHINCHPQARGRGVGSELIKAYSNKLINNGCRGLHIVTAPTARNINFYRRNGFDFLQKRLWEKEFLLFMGRSLRSKVSALENTYPLALS